MTTALDTLRTIDLTIDFADFDAKEKIKMIEAELEKYWQEHPVDDGQEGKGLDEGNQGEQSGSCKHEFVSYKQCCYCGAFENYRGQIIEERTQSNVENLRTRFGDWYFSIKNEHGYPPLAMQIFHWFDKNLGIFNALTNTPALPVADGEGRNEKIKKEFSDNKEALLKAAKGVHEKMKSSAVTGGVKVMEDLLESIDHYFDMLNKNASGQVMKNAYSILEKSAQDSRQYIKSEGQPAQGK